MKIVVFEFFFPLFFFFPLYFRKASENVAAKSACGWKTRSAALKAEHQLGVSKVRGSRKHFISRPIPRGGSLCFHWYQSRTAQQQHNKIHGWGTNIHISLCCCTNEAFWSLWPSRGTSDFTYPSSCLQASPSQNYHRSNKANTLVIIDSWPQKKRRHLSVQSLTNNQPKRSDAVSNLWPLNMKFRGLRVGVTTLQQPGGGGKGGRASSSLLHSETTPGFLCPISCYHLNQDLDAKPAYF